MKKAQNKNEDQRTPHPVRYQWTGEDGTICHGHTVGEGRNQAQAERRFFSQHKHVFQDTTDYAHD